MRIKNALVKYQRKIIIESVILSIILGLIIGFGISLFLSIIFYLFKISEIAMILIIGGLSSVISSILLYYLMLKPDLNVVARRVDEIGLKERVITMLELERKESLMANLQRVDAEGKLLEIKTKALQFKSFKKPIITLLTVVIISIVSMIFLSQEVYAKYYKEYLIEFNSQGGSLIEDQFIRGGQYIVVPKKPQKEGFDFYYWYESDINNRFNFDDAIFENKTLYARWEVKSDEDKIIEQLIKGLRGIVDRANVSESLKLDLHQYIDNLEEKLKPDDTLEMKLAKIEEARKEILRRIKEEIENIKIIKIGDALKEFKSTFELGEAILTKKPTDIDNAIDNLVELLLSIKDQKQQIEALLQTADDIEEALEIANEENMRLRKTLQDLADYLRYLAQEIIEGDIPKDVLENEFIEEMDNIKEELKDILGKDSKTPEENLQEDIEDAFEDAIDELTGDENGNNDKDNESNNGNGDGDDEGDENNPNPDDLIPSIIDGQTQYILMLENLKEQAGLKLLDPSLTQEQRDALNKYINNIDMKLEELK